MLELDTQVRTTPRCKHHGEDLPGFQCLACVGTHHPGFRDCLRNEDPELAVVGNVGLLCSNLLS